MDIVTTSSKSPVTCWPNEQLCMGEHTHSGLWIDVVNGGLAGIESLPTNKLAKQNIQEDR